jgi:cytoskeletal protein CcmA (bactofilin family)
MMLTTSFLLGAPPPQRLDGFELLVNGQELGGAIVFPGKWSTATTVFNNAGGILTLKCTEAEANPKFVFKGSALTTAAASVMVFVDCDTKQPTVEWELSGSATLGATSVVKGSIDAVGTVTLGALSVAGPITATGDVGLGESAKCDSVVTKAAFTAGANAVITGSIDAKDALALGAGAKVYGGITAGAAVSLGANALVTGPVFAVGAVSLGADAAAGPVFAGGAVTLGANARVIGPVSAVGAVSLGADATVTGRVSAGGAITLGAGSTTCTGCPGHETATTATGLATGALLP